MHTQQHLTPNDMCEFNYMRYVFGSLFYTLCYSFRCLVICWLFVWSLEFCFAPFRSAHRKISQSYNIQNHQNSQTTRNNKPFYSNSHWISVGMFCLYPSLFCGYFKLDAMHVWLTVCQFCCEKTLNRCVADRKSYLRDMNMPLMRVDFSVFSFHDT